MMEGGAESAIADHPGSDAMTEQESDPVMERIGEAIGLSRRGERKQARELFVAIWADIGPDGDPFHRCTLAHYVADVQPDPQDELMWDLRALPAADELTDERAQAYHASLSVRGFYPSLHLNLAEDYRKLGNVGRARQELELARGGLDALADDGYGSNVRVSIERVERQLDGPRQPG
jgi:hypothetical protein